MAERVTLRQLQNRAQAIKFLTGVDHYVEIGNGIPAFVRGDSHRAVYKALTKRELLLAMVGYEEGVRLGMSSEVQGYHKRMATQMDTYSGRVPLSNLWSTPQKGASDE